MEISDLTKENLLKMTGVNWTDYQIELLTAMLEAHREGKKLYIMPNMYPRQGKRMIQQTYDMIVAAEKKPFYIFTDELTIKDSESGMDLVIGEKGFYWKDDRKN